MVLGERQLYAVGGVQIPGSSLTREANIFIHGTGSEAALNISEVGRIRNGPAEPIGVYGCPKEKPSDVQVVDVI